MIKRYQVVFYPDKKKAIVPEGETILSAALSCGVHINTACGGQGSCGKCKVIVKEGNVKPLPGSLPAEEGGFPTGVYLACLTSVHGDLEVQVPYESRLDMGDTPKDACSDLNSKNACCAERSFDRAPLSRKYYLKLALPDANDTVRGLGRI